MTVRWKPLIVLSGLFLVIAVMGLLAITYALPGRAEDRLPRAREAARQKKYDQSHIHYQQALQVDPKNVAIHEEMADMIGQWMADVPKKRPEGRLMRIRALRDAAKYGKGRPGPRKKLLVDALAQDDMADALSSADELLPLDATDPDAHYVKALESLDKEPAADLAAAKTHLAVLLKAEPTRPRTLWVKARFEDASNEPKALAETFKLAWSLPVDAKTSSSDRLARLRLRTLEISQTNDPAALKTQVGEFRTEAQSLADEPEPATSRIRVLGALLEKVQAQLSAVSARTAKSTGELTALADSLESVANSVYGRAIETYGNTDLRTHLSYAEHLLFRDKPDECLEVANKALKLQIARLPAWDLVTAGLRETAIKAALSRADDPKKFDKAAPFIRDLASSPNKRYSGMGQFFQGLVALERSGLTAVSARDLDNPKLVDPAMREVAVVSLKKAAAALPDSPTVQAVYGVSLILTGEAAMGRQFLQAGYRMGGEGRLEPRYQVWAAWSILQAGYPEEAEPIVAKLAQLVAEGRIPRELTPTLHLILGEIHQARRTPAHWKLARDEFQKAVAAGQPMTAALQLRLAQIDLQLGDQKQGMERLDQLKGDAKAGPSAERLTVVSLHQSGKKAEAKAKLAGARAKYPDSDELAELDAVIHASEKDNAGAEAILSEFLARHPQFVDLTMLRARLLFPDKPEEARKLLLTLSEKAETSGPLVQLAMLDLGRKDMAGAAKTIAQIRARWKEAAAADLLDAQLALAEGRAQAASAHLDAALKKDPNDKVALFWKALLDERSGEQARASKSLESILKDQPVKEIDDGLSLATAARWALADIALQNQNLDVAISRFEGLLRDGDASSVNRSVRWKLVTANAAKGNLAQAKAEVARLVAEPEATDQEKVQAADFYRRHNDLPACMAQLDAVLKQTPNHRGALAYKALALASTDKADEASDLLRKAMETGDQPSELYLMLAASENMRNPKQQAGPRALAALEEGLVKHPKAIELIQAKYQVLKLQGDPKAVEYVENLARADASKAMKLVLAEVYREDGALEKAEAVVAEVLKESPKDDRLAASLVGLVARQAEAAANAGNAALLKTLDARATELIRKFRATFPTDASFPQAECELAARQGDLAKAKRISDEISALDPGSPIGPLLRARLYGAEGKTDEVVRSYEEALRRSPGRTDIRLALAQANLVQGKTDQALQQTSFVLAGDGDQPTALLLKAEALVNQEGPEADRVKRRAEAAKLLRDSITTNPNFQEAYHLLAEIRLLEGDRAKALNALREGIKVNANDDTGLSALIQHLCEPQGPERSAAPAADVQEAMKLAEDFGKRDERGVFALALAVGFQRAGRIDLAIPWAEKAAARIDQPIVHLTYGDLLLAQAESTTEPAQAKGLFVKAVAEYDAVLRQQANMVEAINNKAWVLHRYLNRNSEALEVAEGLTRRADPNVLPAEFFDTLGSIYEAMSEPKKAEDAYGKGLRKAPEHPTLNYHMGKLLAADRARAGQSVAFLTRAQENKGRLSPEVSAEVESLLKSVKR